jgi:hypothetical protein
MAHFNLSTFYLYPYPIFIRVLVRTGRPFMILNYNSTNKPSWAA